MLYLWYTYNSPDGLSAADISVASDPPGSVSVLAFTPMNGFLNAGSATNLLLAVGGCPNGPLLTGSWIVNIVDAEFNLCLGGLNVSVNCDVSPLPFLNDHLGYANNSVLECCGGFEWFICGVTCGPVSVESESWGRIKSQYR
jgi:hypothetical protein